MTTNWQIAAVDDAARRYPKDRMMKGDMTVAISMRDEAVMRIPIGAKIPDGWIKINILGKIQLPKKPLVDTILVMDDENYKFNYNGYHCYHIDHRRFDREAIIELDKPRFVQSGNSFPPEIEHYMMTISCMEFVDEDALYEMGGGVPPSSDFIDAREEAGECGEDPDDWVENMMKTAEENISACLRSIILFDGDTTEDDCIDAVLIDYKGQ